MLLDLALVMATVWPSLAQDDLTRRPWAWPVSTEEEFQTRHAQSEDAATLLELARWCRERGAFPQQLQVLRQILENDPDHAGAHEMLGFVKVGDAWQPEEMGRRRDQGADLWRAAPISKADQKRILATRDKGLESSGRSSYFDLQTDLAPKQAILYSKVLDEHFRRFKTRFNAYNGQTINVLLFSSRSDYFSFYDRYVGEGGEHVAGFYYDDNLVFYDDPNDRSEVLNTARHECTHLLVDRCYANPAAFPIWLNEGLACYLAAAGDRAEGRYTSALLMTVLDSIESGKPPRFDRLIRRDQDEFKVDSYAHAWSWVHYLNTGPREKKFGRFLDDLQETLAGARNPGEGRTRTATLFEETFGPDLMALEAAWNSYFSGEFALENDRQRADFALHCLLERVYSKEKEQDRQRVVDMALWALDGVTERADEDVKVDVERARITAQLRRMRMAGDAESWRLALRTIRDRLLGLPDSFDPGLKGRLAYHTARAVVDRVSKGDEAYPRDGREVLDQWSADKSETRQALVVLYDDLMEIAAEALAAALQNDPVHRTAVHDWIFLATNLWPPGLEHVFPRIQLLVETDPDDQNLAGFALVYHGLGRTAWARKLLHEAQQRSVLSGKLESYESYFE